jgi:hypothetical protein
MQPILLLIAVVVPFVATSIAFGHGTPIHVEIVEEKLVVSQGVPDPNGFAPVMFFENDEDGDPFGELPVPPFGPSVIYQIPGFEISGMDDTSNLALEVLYRPHAGSVPFVHRTLWYWHEQTAEVQPAPIEALRLRSALGVTELAPTDGAAPPALLLANSMAGQQNFHNHGLLTFLIDNNPVAPPGAYGFFARLSSNRYAPSDPFLVVLNRNVEYENMAAAAAAINAAADDPTPGDYDGNGVVDVDDYQYWRERFGQDISPLTPPDGNGSGLVDAADYVVWRDRHITTTTVESLRWAVPEASGMAIAASAWLGMFAFLGRSRLGFTA